MTTTPGSGDATAAPQYSETDFQLAIAVVTQELEEPVQHIVTLSDEELLAIEGIQHRQLSPLLWAEENLRSDEERAIAVASATRSMIARGLVTTSTIKDPRLPEQTAPDDEIAPALRGTVVARRAADWVLVAERTTSQGKAVGQFFVFDLEDDRRVIFEVFDAMGMHLFFALSFEDLAEQFWLWVDPAREIGEVDGEPEELAAAGFSDSEKARSLGESRAASAVVVRGRGEDAELSAFTLFAKPGQVELMETEGKGDGALVRIAPISRPSLDELVESLFEKRDE